MTGQRGEHLAGRVPGVPPAQPHEGQHGGDGGQDHGGDGAALLDGGREGPDPDGQRRTGDDGTPRLRGTVLPYRLLLLLRLHSVTAP